MLTAKLTFISFYFRITIKEAISSRDNPFRNPSYTILLFKKLITVLYETILGGFRFYFTAMKPKIFYDCNTQILPYNLWHIAQIYTYHHE
jgi:hypothetical protein